MELDFARLLDDEATLLASVGNNEDSNAEVDDVTECEDEQETEDGGKNEDKAPLIRFEPIDMSRSESTKVKNEIYLNN